MFTGGGEQVDVPSNVAPVLEVWLEWFGWHLTSVDVDGQEVYGVVLGVEWVFSIIPIVCVISLSIHHKMSRFGRVPRKRFSCVWDMAPCGME